MICTYKCIKCYHFNLLIYSKLIQIHNVELKTLPIKKRTQQKLSFKGQQGNFNLSGTWDAQHVCMGLNGIAHSSNHRLQVLRRSRVCGIGLIGRHCSWTAACDDGKSNINANLSINAL